ncbi:ABC transporter permease [Corallococcus exiguus]|nr:ABC transporter permease [Corallococcus exiguus]
MTEPTMDAVAGARPARGRRMPPLARLTLTRLREFIREPGTLFWTFVFPILLTVALGSAFNHGVTPRTRVAVVDGPGAERVAAALAAHPGLTPERVPASEANAGLRTGRFALQVTPPEQTGGALAYRFDPTRPESPATRTFVDDVLQRDAGRADARPVKDDAVSAPGTRYVDWLVPGLVGMNVMAGSMWGITFVIVLARQRRLLKRFAATPMRRPEYLLSFALARVVFVLCVDLPLVLGFARVTFGMPIHGSLAAVAAVALAGTFAFSGLAFLCASRARTSETAVGLINMVMVPMMGLAGIFFASSHFPDAVQPLIRALPLSAMNACMRAVINEGAPLSALLPDLAILGTWGSACFALAVRLFRWT